MRRARHPVLKTRDALNESRILILGVQVLLALQYESPLESAFDQLHPSGQGLILAALILLMVSFAMFAAPVPYHIVTAHGQEAEHFQRFVLGVMQLGLLPFAFALGLDFTAIVSRLYPFTVAIAAGAAATTFALALWYGIEYLHLYHHPSDWSIGAHSREDSARFIEMKIEEKVQDMLTEARVVLPGTQALLGVQLIAVMMQGFNRLPSLSQQIHLASLAMIAVSIVLLMTTAAYHRIVEGGEPTEHFHDFASRVVLLSMVPLGLGMCGDFYIVALQISRSNSFAAGTSIAMLLFIFGLWFGVSIYVRLRIGRPRLYR